jgi:Icc protein
MAASAPFIRLLQLTDTHLYADPAKRMFGIDTYQTLSDVVDAALEADPPDLVILSGDVSQDESPRSYERVYEIVRRFRVPIYYIPGNHDLPRVMAQEFTQATPPFREERSITVGNWLFVLLDSTIEGHVEGALSDAELARLDQTLAAYPNHFSLVCLHHNPFSIGSGAFNEIGCANGDELFAVIDQYKNVRIVLCGHVHQEFADKRAGVTLLASPSTCIQFKPRSVDFALDLLPPGFRKFQLHSDGTFDSVVTRLPQLPAGLDAERKVKY